MSCFKAYDVRGAVPEMLNADLAWKIGRAYAEEIRPRAVAVGRDIRLSGAELCGALTAGLRAAGVNVTDLGECATEELYYAVFSQNLDGGVMVTASHNPAQDNGMKFVRAQAEPVSGDTGLHAIRDRALAMDAAVSGAASSGRYGSYTQQRFRAQYVDHVLTCLEHDRLKPLKIVADPGNGCGGPLINELAARLPFEFVFIRETPDGSFPHGAPNPLLPENRARTAQAVLAHKADLGLAWDGDADRCFFFDSQGRFIESYYIVGLLAQAMLARCPGGTILHDPRLVWNTQDIVRTAGGRAMECKTGHAFLKERMRRENAVYGGEMSGHHYFREFAFCDSGMLPWLLVAALASRTGRSLAELVEERMAAFPCSGEINRTVANPEAAVDAVRRRYLSDSPQESRVDGVSMAFPEWRFNLRMSNTEPLLRLNVESRGNHALMREKTEEILDILSAFST